MKTKFDDNVAQDIPTTKDSAEPELPWKLSEAEITRIEATDEEYKSAITAAPPLHARGIFVALLVVVIFVAILNGIVNVVIDNSEMQIDMLRREKQASFVRAALEKAALEKTVLSDNAVKLERRINDLSSQKELYTAVIETLTKKTDDAQIN